MDEIEVIANKTLAEKHLRKFGSFLEQHSLRLMKLLHTTDDHDSCKKQEDFNPSFVKVYPEVHHIWDQSFCPIALTWTPINDESKGFEEIISIPLPAEGNPDVQKVLLVLTNLTLQLNSLKEQIHTKCVLPILLYGDGFEEDFANSSASVSEGDGHVALSKFIPILHQLQMFLKVGKDLCTHWMAQISAIFKDSKPHVVSVNGLELPTVFRTFGDFLGIYIILDEAIGGQTILQDHWSKYRQMIASVQADCSSFGADAEKLSVLERDLFLLDKELISCQIFKNMLQGLKDFGRKTFAKALLLSEKFQSYLSRESATLGKEFSDNDETKPIAVAAIFLFSCTLFPTNLDWKKFFQKHLQEPLKRVVVVPIKSSMLWIPEISLNNFPVANARLYDSKALQLCCTNRKNYLQQKISSLQKDVTVFTLQVATWGTKLQEVFLSTSLNQLQLDDLSRRCNLLSQGLKYAQHLNHTFRIIMGLHAHFGKPVTKQLVVLLCQLLELLKQIENTFFRFSVQVANSSMYIVQHVLHTALERLKGVQKLMSSPELKKMDEMFSDSLSALKIFENSIRGPPSKKRLLVAKLTLEWALSNSKIWKGEDGDANIILPAAIDRTILLTELNPRINELCNGSELFWHRVILSTYFSAVYENQVDAEKLPLMFMIIQDCFRFLDHSPHKEQAKKSFIAEVDGYIKFNVLDKLSQDLETDLRLMAHSHLQTDPHEALSPFRVGVKEYLYLLMSPTLWFDAERSVNFQLVTEYYLSKTFYNLASVALHDWQSYSTMRALAAEKYQLDVTDDHLPGHSLEQGRDILEIVRNLPRFVQEFTYNLNNQVFVQVESKNKHLDTLNIRHLANSMRTHGIGMKNTTVNAAYQYLRPKMHTFSQCLYEEQIRSRLAKDLQEYKQTRHDPAIHASSRNTQTSNFPFKMAEKFKNGVKKLGVQDGQTWLDKFRILVTHIGNALGFVRLVRSGGLHYLAGSCRFIPERVETRGEGLHDVSVEDDYFGLLVGAFRLAILVDRHMHFKNFFVLIPALTLNYVEYMRQCKEMLTKKAKNATIFTDDGFPMGLAYLLQVLNQDTDFDSLEWFHSVKQHYADEKSREVQIINESKNDQKLEQASKLTAKRFQDQLQEFELLKCNLSSARIFFQTKAH